MKKLIIKKMFWLENALVQKLKTEAEKRKISGSALLTHIVRSWFTK